MAGWLRPSAAMRARRRNIILPSCGERRRICERPYRRLRWKRISWILKVCGRWSWKGLKERKAIGLLPGHGLGGVKRETGSAFAVVPEVGVGVAEAVAGFLRNEVGAEFVGRDRFRMVFVRGIGFRVGHAQAA